MITGAQIIVLATPVFLLLIALEFAVGHARGRNTYRLNDTLASIGLGVMSQVTGVFGKLWRLGLYVLAFERLALWLKTQKQVPCAAALTATPWAVGWLAQPREAAVTHTGALAR